MSAWYLCSLGTLFMNKIILTKLNGRVHILGMVQMTMTAVLGALKVYMPMVVAGLLRRFPRLSPTGAAATLQQSLSPLKPVLAAYDPSPLRALQKKSEKYKTFWRDMLFVGAMRGTTVLLGLVSLLGCLLSASVFALVGLFESVRVLRWLGACRGCLGGHPCPS